jgi:hypothetical protein
MVQRILASLQCRRDTTGQVISRAQQSGFKLKPPLAAPDRPTHSGGGLQAGTSPQVRARSRHINSDSVTLTERRCNPPLCRLTGAVLGITIQTATAAAYSNCCMGTIQIECTTAAAVSTAASHPAWHSCQFRPAWPARSPGGTGGDSRRLCRSCLACAGPGSPATLRGLCVLNSISVISCCRCCQTRALLTTTAAEEAVVSSTTRPGCEAA